MLSNLLSKSTVPARLNFQINRWAFVILLGATPFVPLIASALFDFRIDASEVHRNWLLLVIAMVLVSNYFEKHDGPLVDAADKPESD